MGMERVSLSRSRIWVTGLLLCASLFVHAQQENLFSKEVSDAYESALSLNDQRKYFKAYQAMKDVVNALDVELQQRGMTEAGKNLSDMDFQYLYWPANKSFGEIAYAVGLQVEMEKVSAKLRKLIQQRYGEGTAGLTDDAQDDTSLAWRDGYLAEVDKIDAGRYFLTGEYEKAIQALQDALERQPYMTEFVYKVQDEIAQNYYALEDYPQALHYLDQCLASGAFDEDARHGGEQTDYYHILSQRALCLARLGRYDEAKQDIVKVERWMKLQKDPQGYAETLRKKAKILLLEYDKTGRYDDRIPSYYREYLSIARNYIDAHFIEMDESQREQYWLAEQPFVTDCYRLEDKAPAMLYDVALFSKAVLLQMGRDFTSTMTQEQRKTALAAIRMDWKTVWRKMPQTSTAIEFISYSKDGKPHMAAVVLNKKRNLPIFIDIAPLEKIATQKLNEGLTVKEALASLGGTEKDVLYGDSILPELLWNEQLVQAIGDSHDVYFAADGIFHQLAIEYLLPSSLSNKNFHRLTSTRMLTAPHRPFRSDSMLLCGGVDYTASYEQTEYDSLENDRQAYVSLASQNIALPYLEGSRREVDSICVVRHNEQDFVLRGDSVTERTIRKWMNHFHVLSISTHGFFAEATNQGVDIRPIDSDTQLSQSCLFLSGAEQNMRSGLFDSSQPDGILSARELAASDMSNVDVVVLSACQSGLGDITIDGVFGLQRGLKTAGARALVVSLWQVDDQATIQFMLELFKNLKNGMKLHEAFSQARTTLRTTEVTQLYPRRGRQPLLVTKKYNQPLFYDAFILIDGIE